MNPCSIKWGVLNWPFPNQKGFYRILQCQPRALVSMGTMAGSSLAIGNYCSIGRGLKGFNARNRVGSLGSIARHVKQPSRVYAQDTEFSLEEEGEEKPKVYLVDPLRPKEVDTESWAKYKIPHRFEGFNPQNLDLEKLPRFRTDFDGKRGMLTWIGTQCSKCGLQIRKERRTNKETSLNVYAHESIPVEMLRSCPERKLYPLLWRTRDPFIALDVLGVDD